MNARVPPLLHFVFGLRAQAEPFHLVYYLALESARVLNPGLKLHLWLRHLPYGPWWDKIRDHLELHTVDARPQGFAPERYRETEEGAIVERLGLDYAHEADFVRLEILRDYGGVYADIDSLFVQAFPEAYFDAPFTLAEEGGGRSAQGLHTASLCNAILFAAPQAAFTGRWLDEMRASFDGTWSAHSCQAATRLWQADPGSVRLAPPSAFYHYGWTQNALRTLFEDNETPPRSVVSIHLWAHLWWREDRRDFTDFHAGLITPENIRNKDTTYNRIARRFLP